MRFIYNNIRNFAGYYARTSACRVSPQRTQRVREGEKTGREKEEEKTERKRE